MQVDKSKVIEMLKSQGKDGEAQQADNELPEQVDTEQHQGLLEKYGLDPKEMIGKLASGGGGLGGLMGR